MKNPASFYALPLLALGCGQAADGKRNDPPMTVASEPAQAYEAPSAQPAQPSPEATPAGDAPSAPEPMQADQPAQGEPFDYEEYLEQLAWSCISNPTLPPPTQPIRPPRVQYELAVIGYRTPPESFENEPPITVTGLQVFVCVNYPECFELLLCSGPRSALQSSGNEACYRVDDERPTVLALDFPPGSEAGVLSFRAPGYVELDYILSGETIDTPNGQVPLPDSPTLDRWEVPMFSTAAMGELYSSLGLPAADPARGMLMIRALDCRGQPGGRVRIEPANADLEGTRAYFIDGNNAPNYGPLLTDWPGLVGFANMVPQTAMIGATAPTGERIAVVAIPVRAGVVTLAELHAERRISGE